MNGDLQSYCLKNNIPRSVLLNIKTGYKVNTIITNSQNTTLLHKSIDECSDFGYYDS